MRFILENARRGLGVRCAGLAWLLLLPLCAPAQEKQPIIDNDRATVWDFTWTKNEPGFTGASGRDRVTVYLTGGEIKTASIDGAARVVTRKTGEAVFTAKGTRTNDVWTGSGAAPRTVEIALKETVKPPAANASGFPLAFPRPGAKNLLDNQRVLVWDNRWEPGVPTSMHFHDKDLVVTYLEDGDLTSITPDAKSVVNPYKFGVIRFTAGDRSHKEVLSRGTQRAIIVEFK